MPKISIIVPVYNIQNYLSRCIKSIQSQTFNDFELLLINDGSTDNSGEVCDTYSNKDSRIRVIHKSNEGVSSARNLGIQNAKGEFITFVDGDDWVETEYLEQLYFNIKDLGCDVAVCGGCDIDEQGKKLRSYAFEKKQVLQSEETELYDWPYFTYVIHRMLIKKSLIEDVVFDTNLPNGEDTLFLTEVFLKAQNGISFIPYIGYYYFIRSDGASLHNIYSKKKFSAIIAYEKRIKIMKDSGLSMQTSWYNSFLLEVYLLYGYIVQHPEFYSRDHADILFNYLKEYKAYADAIGSSRKFKILYYFMIHNQKLLEYKLKKSELPLGHILGR